LLHATANGNSLYHRYLGKREGDERKVHEEDEITSIVLGPLDFLPDVEVYQFWERVLQSTGHSRFLPTAPIKSVRATFWPRRTASGDGTSITPDGVITFKTEDDQTLILLLELKWRADLSGEDQLHRQWRQFLTEQEQTQALHLFIAPEISSGASAPNNKNAGGDVWKSETGSRLVLLPWLRIRSILAEFVDENSAIGRWASLADIFLEKVGIRKFSGFDHIYFKISLPSLDSAPLFWATFKFSGLATCGDAPILPSFIPARLFFTK